MRKPTVGIVGIDLPDRAVRPSELASVEYDLSAASTDEPLGIGHGLCRPRQHRRGLLPERRLCRPSRKEALDSARRVRSRFVTLEAPSFSLPIPLSFCYTTPITTFTPQEPHAPDLD